MKAEYGYQALRRVLELGEDADFLPDENGNISRPQEPAPSLIHKNIRGREYFSPQILNTNRKDNDGNR